MSAVSCSGQLERTASTVAERYAANLEGSHFTWDPLSFTILGENEGEEGKPQGRTYFSRGISKH